MRYVKFSVVIVALSMMALCVYAATCGQCGGTGMLSCRNCGGSGTVSVIVPGPFGPCQSLASCPACVQRGLLSVIQCNRCSGTGQIYSPSFGGGVVYRCVNHPGCSFSNLHGNFDKYNNCRGCGCSLAIHK